MSYDKDILLELQKRLENMNQREKNIFFNHIGIDHFNDIKNKKVRVINRVRDKIRRK